VAKAKARGVKFGAKPKLTDQQRREVAKRLLDGESPRDIAKIFNASFQTVIRHAKSMDLRLHELQKNLGEWQPTNAPEHWPNKPPQSHLPVLLALTLKCFHPCLREQPWGVERHE
jgi:hypothetical protein